MMCSRSLGEINSLHSFSILLGILSGPAALCGFRLFNNLFMPVVLCCNWQGPTQGSTPMPQWRGEFRVGGGLNDSYTVPVCTDGMFYFPWQTPDRRLLVSPLKDTGKAG